MTTECPAPILTGPALSPVCTAEDANSNNNFTSTTCVVAPGQKQRYVTTTTTTTTSRSNTQITNIDVVPNTAPIADLDSICYPNLAVNPDPMDPVAQGPALPPNGRPTAGLPPLPPAPCTAWPCSTDGENRGGSINSLADVAQYYYATDLRPNMPDIVETKGSAPEGDWVKWQHMVTFTMGLGVSGTLKYTPNYKTDVTTPPTDFQKLRLNDESAPANLTLNWPTWPSPANLSRTSDAAAFDDPRSIDDFWHAAVNGRGQFFSAASPDSVKDSLVKAFGDIRGSIGAGGAAASSTAQPTQTNNFIYSTSYKSVDWTGDILARRIDPATGILTQKPVWSAQDLLKQKVAANCDNRKIYLFRNGAGAGTNLTDFTWDSSACDSSGNPIGAATTGLDMTERGNFGVSKVSLLSQYAAMSDGTASTVNQRAAAVGSNLVNFLRGQSGFEDFKFNIANQLYRKRASALGDIVTSASVVVQSPTFNYADNGYSAFKTAQSSRKPMLYVGANDGMLHAFNASKPTADPVAGTEAWAFIPTMVLPNLYALADNNYSNNHIYTVDGTPAVGDVYDGSAWRTVLVGGLNAGGKGYYALDITDPDSPKALWEFKWKSTCYDGTQATADGDCYLGLTFGKPIISKLGTQWVAFVTSGYNNVNTPSKVSDGKGFLYALDIITGKIVLRLATTVGSNSDPSGLAQMTNFVDNADVNNKTSRLYGGDLTGSIWRFDVDGDANPPTGTVSLIATAKDSKGATQPITTRPRLTEVAGTTLITVGTGQLLGAIDLESKQQQSVYTIPDNPTTPASYSDLRTALTPLVLTTVVNGAATQRTIACNGTGVICTRTGWFVDLQASSNPAAGDIGARVNVDIASQNGTTSIPVNIPSTEACTAGGNSYLLSVSTTTGLAVNPAVNTVSTGMYNALIAGLTELILEGNQYAILLTLRNSETPLEKPAIAPPNPVGKRISWREVIQ
jgi:type IV pilus assembly protein PilY1